jgi:hypothetical protein
LFQGDTTRAGFAKNEAERVGPGAYGSVGVRAIRDSANFNYNRHRLRLTLFHEKQPETTQLMVAVDDQGEKESMMVCAAAIQAAARV